MRYTGAGRPAGGFAPFCSAARAAARAGPRRENGLAESSRRRFAPVKPIAEVTDIPMSLGDLIELTGDLGIYENQPELDGAARENGNGVRF